MVTISPSVKADLQQQGYDVAANRPEEFAQFIKADIARTVALVKRFGIRPDECGNAPCSEMGSIHNEFHQENKLQLAWLAPHGYYICTSE